MKRMNKVFFWGIYNGRLLEKYLGVSALKSSLELMLFVVYCHAVLILSNFMTTSVTTIKLTNFEGDKVT